MIGYRITTYGAAGKVIGARYERRGTVGRGRRARPGDPVGQGWTEGMPPARLIGRMKSNRLLG
jgi:hypothetical protein